jgi:hypothetical protein
MQNAEPPERHGRIMVAEQPVDVSQSGDAESCQYSVAPVEMNPCMASPQELTTMITTQPSCPWTASPNASWITITRGQSGSGTGIVGFRITDNWDAPREGIVMVRWPTPTAGQNVRVRQAGCAYAVTRPSINVGAAGGTETFDVLQVSDPITCGGPTQNACLWTAVAEVPWITITTSQPQVGDNRVTFTVAPNAAAASRSGTIRVRDKSVLVVQAGQ